VIRKEGSAQGKEALLRRTSVRADLVENSVPAVLAAHNVPGGKSVQSIALAANVLQALHYRLGLATLATLTTTSSSLHRSKGE